MEIRRAWGGVWAGRDANGFLTVTLENPALRCKYGLLVSDEADGPVFETNITSFFIKSEQQDQVQSLSREGGDRIDAAAWRGLLSEVDVTREDADRITLRMAWTPVRGPAQVQEVTIHKGAAYLQIRYVAWFVNIVDFASPGGTHQGEYAIHGAERWIRPYTYYPQIYFDRAPSDVGQENITEVEDPAPLDYKGWFIMGIYHPANGVGYGRVMPVEAIDIIKLLFNDARLGKRGFELFPYYQREHQPYTGYLFPVSGGLKGAIRAGQAIADGACAGNLIP